MASFFFPPTTRDWPLLYDLPAGRAWTRRSEATCNPAPCSPTTLRSGSSPPSARWTWWTTPSTSTTKATCWRSSPTPVGCTAGRSLTAWMSHDWVIKTDFVHKNQCIWTKISISRALWLPPHLPQSQISLNNLINLMLYTIFFKSQWMNHLSKNKVVPLLLQN